MDRGKAATDITASFNKLDLNRPNSFPSSKSSIFTPLLYSSGLAHQKAIPPSLVSLCLGIVGRHLEDIIGELSDIAVGFPAPIKMAIAAIARRRKLLCDEVIVPLVDSSWDVLDISGSDVSDSGLAKVAEICKVLRAVDISQCKQVTAAGVYELVQRCKSLQTLRCGGCPRSDFTARSCLGILKPKLNDVEGDSWEELDTAEIAQGAESLRWFVWPRIDKDSLETLAAECPRIIVNPKPSPFGFRGLEVPREALPDAALDDPTVKDINPKTWALYGHEPNHIAPSLLSEPNHIAPSLLSSPELSIAEKFRLAFVERDTRLAPKRAKNARQHQRRAERDWMMSTDAKAIVLASKASKSLHSRN